MMNRIDALKEQIEKAAEILSESQENLDNNPGNYSARLLVMSIENHLEDLLRQLHTAEAQADKSG